MGQRDEEMRTKEKFVVGFCAHHDKQHGTDTEIFGLSTRQSLQDVGRVVLEYRNLI